jgi:uncharacterized membrane protein YcaP (DUF421 family)
MSVIEEIFGAGRDLSVFQMTNRAIVMFFIALVLIRISGRRSFGLHAPLDNIISIILGAVLSRAIVGASDFLPVITSSAVLVLLHRLFALLMVHHPGFSKLVAGDKILVFKNGIFIEKNMNRAQVCKDDILQEVRRSALTEDLEKIEKVYIERNGEINAVKK